MYTDKLRFNKDGKFTILQVSDAQDLHIRRKAMFKMLDTVYDKINPDLIVLTGDNILGNHLNDAPVGNRQNVKTKEGTLKRMKTALNHLLQPINDRKIPFAFIYGNHDDMNKISKKEQAEIYKSYDYCIPYNETDDSIDCDTYNIPIFSSQDENKMKYNIWMLDSAGADENGKPTHCKVLKNTMDWYENKSRELERENGEKIMSLMFQHVPCAEIKEFYIDCDENDKNAIRCRDGKFRKLNPEKAIGYSFEYEENDTPDCGQLEVLRKRGDVCGLVFGHDHMNSFTGELDGVNIVQTSGASFRCYGNLISRGVRVFTIDENNTEAFETYQIGYFDLFGKKFKSVFRYIFSADEYEKIKAAIIALIAVIGAGLLIYILAMLNLLG
ncbi:MAG: metallophosphoesterase [Ruminococcus sp.]|nr:metallophosphoesterase [Candidatus Copronaster equi]